ncbi:DUF4252 domain-containing protein [Antarcticibacterium arcticum]|uniref:DUF4252 domain-containing protein n=1 Tax=Antarcticibacterium arcticum TaxID=2585771 RepID=A0A5B8YJF3_9FLAO|nr:DUF4252 domain-containing protein [Antarcticibacterium arcticum]QED37228.1 DUF4252 domain-containing protein [Antarcticibacterium arcticum]
MRFLKFLSVVILGIGITACNGEQSLQEYYVENQNNKDFVAIDIPASMLTNMGSLDDAQRRTLETVKKVNVLAIPKKAENIEKIENEKLNVANILKDEKYQLLMRYGSGDTRVEIYFTGEEEAVNEIILYGFDENRGMGLARVLGDEMNPGDILALVKSMEKGDIDLSGFSGLNGLFAERVQ